MSKKIIWTDNEINIIVNNYENNTPYELVELLKGEKTYKQVKRKINELGFKHLNEKDKWSLSWTKKDDKYILNNYETNTISEISKKLNKEYRDVIRRYKFLNKRRPQDTELFNNKFISKFSKNQIDYIKLNHLNYSASKIANNLNVKYDEVVRICDILNLKWLTRNDIFNEKVDSFDREIKILARDHTIREIANKLEIDYNFVFRRCKKLNINCVSNKERKNLIWTQEEKDNLILINKDYTPRELAKLFKKPLRNIYTTLKHLELQPSNKKYVDNSKLTDEKYQWLLENHDNYSLLDICNYLQKDSRSIILKMIFLVFLKDYRMVLVHY